MAHEFGGTRLREILKTMYCALLMFRVNLLPESQVSTFLNWLLACMYNEKKDLFVKNIFKISEHISKAIAGRGLILMESPQI